MIITATTAAATLIPQNSMRKSLLIQNTDASVAVYVKRERNETATVSASDFDFKIGPGASATLSSVLDGLTAIQDRYTVIAASATAVVAVFETEDIGR